MPSHPAQSRRIEALSRRGWGELAIVVAGFVALTVVLTFPVAFHLGTVGRVDNGDGQFSIWNVAWVARTLVVDPLHVFDANIFYPHRWTLAYSETNLGAGIFAIPVYWATRNPYAAHNFVFLLSFVLSATGAYYLVRYLTGDRRAAAVAGICFAFCPHVFARTPHIQLLMTAGLPFSMLAFHRLADRPTPLRGAVLGSTMAAQALFCGYYAVFVMLMIGFAVLVVAAIRRRWTDRPYWTAVSVGAGVAIALAAPLFAPYIALQHSTGFHRSLEQARPYSADWQAYFTSSSYAHFWMLDFIRQSKDSLFPGFVALGFGVAGLAAGWMARGRLREVSIVYGALAVLACWASFGPAGGLYSALYATVPVFNLLRGPSRLGIVVTLALSVLAGVAISAMLRKPSRPTLAAILLMAVTAAELYAPSAFRRVPRIEQAYYVLASLPRGAVLELPVYSSRFAFVRTQYMLSSTVHWMPLVDGYSDYTPQDFYENMEALGAFPNREAFAILERDHVRYAVFHVNLYNGDVGRDLRTRLREFDRYLVRRYGDDWIELYEIVGFPH
jgi:hypothetical protein